VFTSLAQQGFILSGQVTDANNKPVKNAGVKVVGKFTPAMANTNKYGLYQSFGLQWGSYDVTILTDGKVYVGKVSISPTDPVKRFYNFKLQGKTAVLTVTEKDMFREAVMKAVKDDPNSRIDGVREDMILYYNGSEEEHKPVN
jgi:hypothetical protein